MVLLVLPNSIPFDLNCVYKMMIIHYLNVITSVIA